MPWQADSDDTINRVFSGLAPRRWWSVLDDDRLPCFYHTRNRPCVHCDNGMRPVPDAAHSGHPDLTQFYLLFRCRAVGRRLMIAGIGSAVALLCVVTALAELAHAVAGLMPRDGPLLQGSLAVWMILCAACVLGGAALVEHADYEISHGASARASHD